MTGWYPQNGLNLWSIAQVRMSEHVGDTDTSEESFLHLIETAVTFGNLFTIFSATSANKILMQRC